MNFFGDFRYDKNRIQENETSKLVTQLVKEDLTRNKCPMARVVKKEPDWNGAVRSDELRTVNLLNNQKLLRRLISKIVLLVENEMVRFPTEEINKG